MCYISLNIRVGEAVRTVRNLMSVSYLYPPVSAGVPMVGRQEHTSGQHQHPLPALYLNFIIAMKNTSAPWHTSTPPVVDTSLLQTLSLLNALSRNKTNGE